MLVAGVSWAGLSEVEARCCEVRSPVTFSSQRRARPIRPVPERCRGATGVIESAKSVTPDSTSRRARRKSSRSSDAF